jgi:hypothetical protein
VTLRVFLPETTLPSVKITNSPPNFTRLDSGLVTLAGTAADNVGLDRVEFQVNNGSPQTAIGTNYWTAEVRLVPGNNTVRVHSVDLAGNVSKPVTRYFTYVVQDVLSVQIAGEGTVTPDLNGHSLEIGKYYRITAQPGANHLFTGWTGGLSANAAPLNFQMKSNLVLIAHFVPNPFPPVAGAYSGVFFHTNFVLPLSSGFFSLQLARPGSFSGKVRITGVSYPFHGKFSPGGTAAFAVLRRAQVPLVLSLQLDLAKGLIHGSVSDGTSTSSLLADRDVFEAGSNPAPQAGRHSFVLQRLAAEGGEQLGSGVAKISTSGAVALSGTLNDQGKFSLSTALASDGSVPVYLSLAHGAEVVVGWMHVPEQPPTLISGDLFEANAEGIATEIEVAPGEL